MRVVIIGGGVGGLALAHGLRRRGVAVTVHERDEHAGARWEGYRIHLDPNGLGALAACLPPEHLRLLLETGSDTNDFTMTSEHLRVLVSIPGDARWPPVDGRTSHVGVDRAVLRRVLLAGLDDTVRLGAEFVHYDWTGDGPVTSCFADGSRVEADVLVGADGGGSRVARALFHGAAPRPSGGLAIVQRLPLTDERRAWIPEVLTRGMTVTCPSQPGFMFTAAFRPEPGVRERLAGFGIPDAPEVGPYLVVSLVLPTASAPAGIESMDAAALTDLCVATVNGWHPTVRRLVDECDPAGRRVLIFRAADPVPTVPVEHVPITVLGDAFHQMPPVGGLGGNTALRDAQLLADTLATSDATSVAPALRDYEARVREYAGRAVRDALKMQAQNLATDGLFTTLPSRFYRMSGDVPAVERIESAQAG